MKNPGPVFILCTVLLFGASSCQKAYERPDIIIGTPSTGGITTGPLLVKAEAKTSGSTEASVVTYEYDANKRVTRIITVATDSSNNSVTVVYRYARDVSGKITQIVSNIFSATQPGAGFPDSLYVDVHYPAGSSNFDYVKYSINFGGATYVDSIAYTYTNNLVTAQSEYTGVLPSVAMSLLERIQYSYTNGNITAEKYYDLSSTTVPIGVVAIEYDAKTAALTTGNEGFLPGQNLGFASKNNPTKETYSDNRVGTVVANIGYTFQYNSDNVPVTGISLQTIPVNKMQSLKFTYQ